MGRSGSRWLRGGPGSPWRTSTAAGNKAWTLQVGERVEVVCRDCLKLYLGRVAPAHASRTASVVPVASASLTEKPGQAFVANTRIVINPRECMCINPPTSICVNAPNSLQEI